MRFASSTTQQPESATQSPARGSRRGRSEIPSGQDSGGEDIDGFVDRLIDEYVEGEQRRPAQQTPEETVSANEKCRVPDGAPDGGGDDHSDGGGGNGRGGLRKESDGGVVSKEKLAQNR